MEQNINKKNLSVAKIMFLFRFFGDALFYNFLTRYFSSLGFSPFELGTLIAVIPLMSVVGNVSLSFLATSKKNNYILILVWTVVESIFIFSFGFVKEFYLVLIFDMVCCFCSNSFYNLLDTFTLDLSEKAGKSYASLRLFGSLAYVLGTAIGGLSIKFLSYRYDFMISGALFIVAGLIFLLIKFDKSYFEIPANTNEDKISLKGLFSIKNFFCYLIFIVLMFGMNNSADNLFGIYTSNLKISDDIYGYFSSSTIAVECLMMILSAHILKKSSFFKLLFIGSLALILRLIIFSIPNMDPYIYLSTQILRGVTYGCYLSAHINLLSKIVGIKYLSKAIFVIAATQQLISALTNQISPVVSSTLSYSVMFSIMLGIALFSLIFLTITYRKECYETKSIKS